jgi:hypothetical protein
MITACRGLSNARRGSPPQWALAVWQRDREIARADIHRGPEPCANERPDTLTQEPYPPDRQ